MLFARKPRKCGQAELEADRFARALLMPQGWFIASVRSGLNSLDIAKRYRVELRRVVERYADLDIPIPPDARMVAVIPQ